MSFSPGIVLCHVTDLFDGLYRYVGGLPRIVLAGTTCNRVVLFQNMTTIVDLIESSQQKVRSLLRANREWSRTSVATPVDRGIPTLEPGIYQPLTPQLKERCELFGRWEWTTHGHWLGIPDMECALG
jgi:hypothetical protein